MTLDFGYTYRSIVKTSSGSYKIEGISRDDNAYPDEIRIYIIDNKRGIAVFEMREKGEVSRRLLCVDASKARNIPLIIHCYSATVIKKPPYYALDSIDFEKLLKEANYKYEK